jgi:hypothetical protein
MYPNDTPKWRDWYFANFVYEGAGESKEAEDIELVGEVDSESERRGTKRVGEFRARRVRRPRLELLPEDDTQEAAVRVPENRRTRASRRRAVEEETELAASAPGLRRSREPEDQRPGKRFQ